ncbi:MAG: FUSC family protein [Comamonas sp.]
MAWPRLPRFTRAELLFSAKSFAAAMLAVYLANRAGLARPFWALMTTYIVAHPLAGAVRSKALFRFGGTLIGSLVALLMIQALADEPVLLGLALALWVGACVSVSLLDRTPRAYLFMLAGYTVALIGLPSVETPQAIFETAVLRVEEIGLGILCASVVHSVFWPSGLAPSVLGLIDRTMADGRRWLDALLGTRTQGVPAADARLDAERRRLAGDITQLRLLSTHVPFDTTHLRWTAGAIRAMQDRVAALTPHLSAVEDRLQALAGADGALPPDVAALLEEVAQWLQARDTAGTPGQAVLVSALRAYPPDQGAAVPADGAQRLARALRIGLAQRLEELVDEWQACARLRRDIDVGLSGAAAPLRRQRHLGDRVLHRDHGLALLSGLAAALSVGLCCAFWALTGWSYGYVAVMVAAVFCSLFAAMDDPVPAMHGFLKWTLWSIPLSALYVLVLLPLVSDFGMLVLICAPFFLVLGGYLARPAYFGASMAMFFGVAGTLAMHDTASADLVSFLNFLAAQIVGVVIAARTTRLMRSVGAQWSARRIQRATWHELGEMAGAAGGPPDPGYAVRMLDRIGLLAPRIAQAGGTVDGVVANDALRDLRVGTDLATLQRARSALQQVPIAPVLAPVADYFGRRADGRAAPPAPELLGHIDRALDAALQAVARGAAPAPGRSSATSSTAAGQPSAIVMPWLLRPAVAALVGLRRNLLPDAPGALAGAAPSPDASAIPLERNSR